MIESLRLRGVAGSLLWGYRTVADLGTWAILHAASPLDRPAPGVKRKPSPRGWRLQAALLSATPPQFVLRAGDLRFTAPRWHGPHTANSGFWCFKIVEPPVITNGILVATLGAPEH